MKTTYTLEITRAGADRYHEEIDGFLSVREAKAYAAQVQKAGELMDRVLTSFVVHKNTHTSNPWRA